MTRSKFAAITLVSPLLLATAAVVAGDGRSVDMEAAAAFAADDECVRAGRSEEECSLNALQMRGMRMRESSQFWWNSKKDEPPPVQAEDPEDIKKYMPKKQNFKKEPEADEDGDEKEKPDDDEKEKPDDDEKKKPDDDDNETEKPDDDDDDDEGKEKPVDDLDDEKEKPDDDEKEKPDDDETEKPDDDDDDDGKEKPVDDDGDDDEKEKPDDDGKEKPDEEEEEEEEKPENPTFIQKVDHNPKTPPVVIKGNLMYDSKSGARFFSKGVAYNPRNQVFDPRQMAESDCTPGHPPKPKLEYAADPTADDLEDTWKEAMQAIAKSGANTVRLYNIDPEQDHKKFMDYVASLGLYVIIPLTRHDWGFLPAGMPAPLCYTGEIEGYGNVGTNVLTSAKLIVKEFSQYDNTLLFTVANEMTVADPNGYAAFPCVKALTRDVHRYQAECKESMRRVPLIYADMDMGPPYRELVGRYLACEVESKDDAVDAYGLNVYSWCNKEYPDETGNHNFEYSPYGPIRKEFQSLSIPLIFSEFGCKLGEYMRRCPYDGGRTWDDVPTFFNEFKEIASGAVAFEFSMEDNEFGLALTPGFMSGKANADDMVYTDEYYALKKQFSKYSVDPTWDGADVADCAWKPAKAAKMAHKHRRAKCPKLSEVEKLFDAKALSVEPNWDKLPPTPEGADANALKHCPKYDVAPAMKKEGCCHYEC